jgi:Tol biopolymer transport system component
MRKLVVAVLVIGALGVGSPPAGATFPGLNGLVTWSRVRMHQDVEIFGRDLSDGTTIQITHNDRVDFEPAWSPDGRHLAFTSCSSSDCDVWVADADGTDERNVTANEGQADRWPSWSPDGRWIVYSSQNFDGTSSISVISVDGSRRRQLVDDTFANQEPVWSPNGQWIAFASSRSGTFDLWRMEPSGRHLEQLTATPDAQEENPNWHPDGTQLLFDGCISATYPCPGFAPNYEIFTMLGNGEIRRLTASPGIDNNPAWSPDGSTIVFRSDRTRFTALWLMNADGTNERILTPKQFNGGVDPDWQPVPRNHG